MLGAYVRTRAGLVAGALRLDRAEERSSRAGRDRAAANRDRLAGLLFFGAPTTQAAICRLVTARARGRKGARRRAAGSSSRRAGRRAASHLEKAADRRSSARRCAATGLTIPPRSSTTWISSWVVDRIVGMDFGARWPKVCRRDPRRSSVRKLFGGVAERPARSRRHRTSPWQARRTRRFAELWTKGRSRRHGPTARARRRRCSAR